MTTTKTPPTGTDQQPAEPEEPTYLGIKYSNWLGDYEFGRDPVKLSPAALERIARAKKAREAKLCR